MDRHDERKDHDTDDAAGTRSGDVLGLSGSPVPKHPDDPSASDDPASAARRRERMRSEEEATRREDPDLHHKGATGIDMGAGGEGTDISGR
jgi:hypothetical protein